MTEPLLYYSLPHPPLSLKGRSRRSESKGQRVMFEGYYASLFIVECKLHAIGESNGRFSQKHLPRTQLNDQANKQDESLSLSILRNFDKSLVDRIHSYKWFNSSEIVFEFKEDASNYLGEPTLLRFQNRLMNKKNLLPPLQYITKKLVASSNRHSPAGNHMLSRSSFINL
nr:unnamed protein product [Ipomoea trifida]